MQVRDAYGRFAKATALKAKGSRGNKVVANRKKVKKS